MDYIAVFAPPMVVCIRKLPSHTVFISTVSKDWGMRLVRCFGFPTCGHEPGGKKFKPVSAEVYVGR
jgi:hypothetical protein